MSCHVMYPPPSSFILKQSLQVMQCHVMSCTPPLNLYPQTIFTGNTMSCHVMSCTPPPHPLSKFGLLVRKPSFFLPPNGAVDAFHCFFFGGISIIFTGPFQHFQVLVQLIHVAGNHFLPSNHFYLQINVFFCFCISEFRLTYLT